MKRKLTVLILCYCLILMLAGPVFAQTAGYVLDYAQLMDPAETARLEENARQLAAQYQCGVYAVTVQDYLDYGSSPESAARNIYESHDLGYGSERDGMILLLSMAERDYYMLACGSGANGAFTEATRLAIADAFLPCFAENDWQGGFECYLEESGDYLEKGPASERSFFMTVLLILVLPCAVAGIVCLVLWLQMKSVARQTCAAEYVVAAQSEVTDQSDRFVRRTVSRRKIESARSGNRSSSGNGGKF